MTAYMQETLAESAARDTERIWVHDGCGGGWVRFTLRGGFCMRCDAGPLKSAQYAKPGGAA
jgi:hypothetical protein